MKIQSKAVVTGGAGFIGSHLVDLLLEKNYKVIVIDNFIGGHEKNLNKHKNNKNLEVYDLDICKLEEDNKIFKEIDYIFHFAGLGDIVPSIENPYEYLKTNIMGTVKMLNISRNCDLKKFLYAASSSCYGLAKTPTREDHPIDTKYPYALSKYQGEQCCFHWHKVYNLPILSLRIFNAYGPRVRTTGAYGAVFGVFLKQKLENKPLTVVGDGKQTRDFIFVTDLAEAFYIASQSNITGEYYNIVAGNPQSINKLTKLIGGDVTYIPKRPGEPDSTWADISKFTKDFKWRPKIKFEDGVKIIIQNIQNWQDAPLWNKDNINEATKTWFKYMTDKNEN